jgi:hypothetical protein
MLSEKAAVVIAALAFYASMVALVEMIGARTDRLDK